MNLAIFISLILVLSGVTAVVLSQDDFWDGAGLVEESSEEAGETNGIADDLSKEFSRLYKDGCNLTGMWFNQHNSRLSLKHHRNGTLTGTYKTAVETKRGSAGGLTKLVNGQMSGSNLFVFYVFWNEGNSVTSWTGQCHQEGGNLLIKTSWILTSKHDNCDDHWASNRFGQDTFHQKPIKLLRPQLKRS